MLRENIENISKVSWWKGSLEAINLMYKANTERFGYIKSKNSHLQRYQNKGRKKFAENVVEKFI